MSATDRGASASTYARRSRAAAGFYNLNPGVKKSLYSGAAGQENSAKVAGLLAQAPCCPPPIMYTVTYNANGGTGIFIDPASPYKLGSRVIVLGGGSFTRSGYLITGFTNGSGSFFAIGDSFTITGPTILYAQWVLSYTVTYDGYGANEGDFVPRDILSPYAVGSTVTVLSPTGELTRDAGEYFGGWTDGTNDYLAGDTFIINQNTILQAIWYSSEPVTTYTVTYSNYLSDGGTPPDDTLSPYADGSTVTVLDNNYPAPEGPLYRFDTIFAGWNTNNLYTGTMYVAGDTFVLTSDITLYPEWYAT